MEGIMMDIKSLILTICATLFLILLFDDNLINKISVKNLAILVLIFIIIITTMLFYIF